MIVIIAREEQKARTKRYEELMMDYPGLIMKFTLLVQAGMTVRNTFRKMASDYKNKNEKRIAYEELVLSLIHIYCLFYVYKNRKNGESIHHKAPFYGRAMHLVTYLQFL